MKLPNLKTLAMYAGYVLAIYGVLSLLSAPIRFAYRIAYFSDAAGLARPFCVPYAFWPPAGPEAGNTENWYLVGVRLNATSKLENARFYFGTLRAVGHWEVFSSDLSVGERKGLLDGLPTGILQRSVVSAPLPPLREGAEVTLAAIAAPESPNECPNPDSITVRSTTSQVYTTDSRFLPIQGKGLQMSPSSLVTIILLVVAAVLALCYRAFQVLRARHTR